VSSSIPLTNAVTSGDESAVSALLAEGADVNESTSGGQTPLILAVIFGHTHIVQQLVQAGADPEQRDNLGLNAIEWAQRRGLAEALDILTNTRRASTPPKKILINFEEPELTRDESREPVSDAEKSKRWIAGFKQRLNEEAARRLNRNEAPEIPSEVIAAEPPPPEPKEVVEETQALAPREPVTPVHSSRILTPPVVATPSGKRKRCPQCNAIYNGDLVSYCAVHMVPLVDADQPIVSDAPKKNPPLFWILVIATLAASIGVGSLLTTYFYRSSQARAGLAADQPARIIKGSPQIGPELAGKQVSLPEAECPFKDPEPPSGTVVVRILVDKNGQVYWARGSGGDWLMRGAANEAAMKSTFSPEKLRGHEAEGTITYTFKP
jgi:outer membrane biosynthesis protein TonB